jgi:oxygen-independent coproporphyrinogen-3 oxidase
MLDGRRMATEAERLPEKWLAGVEKRGSSIALTDISTEAAREHLLMGLRLAEGIDLEAYHERWKVAPSPSRIAELSEDGLVSTEGSRLRATARGRFVLNSVIAQLANSLK